MKRLPIVLLCMVIAILALSTLPLRSTGQDNTDERLAALETRVSSLESQLGISTAIATEGASFQIRGMVVVIGGVDLVRLGSLTCNGIGPYADLVAGALVTIKNESGVVIGTGSLEEGFPDPTVDRACDMSFSVDVPKAEFYSIEVTHRGEVTFAYTDLVSNGWFALMQIGNI